MRARSPSRHGVPFVARGSGTGLAGGAVPPDGAIVISTTKMNRILSRRPGRRGGRGSSRACSTSTSSRAVAVHGLHFAPDPSSQQTCSIGGNVANNSGGPHCLAEGVTNAHILALEVVLPGRHRHRARRRGPRAARARPARRVRRQRGDARRDDQGVRAADARPAGDLHDAHGLRLGRGRRVDRQRGDRGRRRAGGDGDDGPAVPAGRRGLHPAPGCRSTRPPRCSSRSSGCPTASPPTPS